MADLEQSGLQFVALGADEFTRQVDSASKAVDRFNKSVASAGDNSASGALGGVVDQLGNVAAGAEGAAGALGAAGGAGAAAGGSIAAGLAAALPIIGAVVVAIGGLVAAANSAHSAMESALSFSGAITNVQNLTGLSSEFAQQLNVAAGVGKKSLGSLANDFLAVGDAADRSVAQQEKALTGAGGAVDKFGSRLQRLSEDYERAMADIAQRLADRQAEINARLEEAQVNLNERLTRLAENYNESVADARAALGQRLGDLDNSYAESVARLNERLSRLNEDYNRTTEQNHADRVQRLADLDASHADSVANINERLKRLDEDYVRSAQDAQETLNQRLADLADEHADRINAINANIAKAQKQLADKRADIESRLTDKLAKLNQNASDDIESEQKKAAKTQAGIQEDLQKELAQITEKYTQARQSLEEKITDPNTNPILRAYYQTQVQRLKEVEAAEKASATATAENKAQQAANETAAIIQEIKDRLAQEKALAEAAAAEDLARAEQEAADRIAVLQSQLAEEAAEYQEQTARINAEYLKRQADRQRIYEQEQADLLAQLAREDAEYAGQTERINAEYAAREAERQRIYQQQQADLQAQLDREAAQHTQQTARLKAEEARREADFKKSYDRQTADANEAYQKQVENAASAQAKILAETAKRIDAEKLQYQRGIEDATTSLQTGSAAAVQAVDPVAAAFARLGINVKEYAKLSPDEKFKALSEAVGKFVDEGKGQEAIEILSQIMGREKATEFVTGLTDIKEQWKLFQDLGLLISPEDIKQGEEMRKKINAMTTASDLLWTKIGYDLLPIWRTWLTWLEKFWKEHGPKIISALERFTNETVPAVVGAISWAWQKFNDFLDIISRVYNFVSGNLTVGLDWLRGKLSELEIALAPVGNLFESLGNVKMAATNKATEALSGLWQRVLLPALQDVESFISGKLGSAFQWITDTVMPPFHSLMEKLSGTFRVIGDKINEVAGKVNEFANRISSISLPWWLTPGSPTPFEWGLRGIADSLKMVENAALPSFDALDTSGQMNITRSMTQAPSFQQPATFSQQAAGQTFNNSTSTANIYQTFTGNVDKATVRDGTYEALTRAGIQVVY